MSLGAALTSVVMKALDSVLPSLTNAWVRRFSGETPTPEVLAYLARFQGRNRSPSWDSKLESRARVELAQVRIARVPFGVQSASMEQATLREAADSASTISVPALTEQLIRSAGFGPIGLRRRDKPTRVFLLLGAPASGKSSFTIQCATWAAWRAESDSTYPVPVYVNLNDFNDAFSLDVDGLVGLIGESIAQDCPRRLGPLIEAHEDPFARSLTQRGCDAKVLFIFDGLDEVPADKDNAQHHAKRITAIARFIELHPQQMFLVTCRDSDYVALRNYRQTFEMRVHAVQPWTQRLFRRYVAARSKDEPLDPKTLKARLASAGNREVWGPLSNTPFLAAMLLSWPNGRGEPTASALWAEFIKMRLRPHVASEELEDCLAELERIGMRLTLPTLRLRNENARLRFTNLARRAGILGLAGDGFKHLEFTIKPLQHYFTARYMHRWVAELEPLPLSHQRLHYATRLFIELGGTTSGTAAYLVRYLLSSHTTHELARAFEIVATCVSIRQVRSNSELEDTLVAVIDEVLAKGNDGDLYYLMEGVRVLPELLFTDRLKATMLIRGILAIGTPIMQRRLLQLGMVAPRLFLGAPREFFMLVRSLAARGSLAREVAMALATLPVLDNAARRATRTLAMIARALGVGWNAVFLYGAYLAALWCMNRAIPLTAHIFALHWPYARPIVVLPRGSWDWCVRLALVGLVVGFPWFLTTGSIVARLRRPSLPTKIVVTCGAAIFIRYLFGLPVLGLVVAQAIPSRLELSLVLSLTAAPLAAFLVGVLGASRSHPKLSPGHASAFPRDGLDVDMGFGADVAWADILALLFPDRPVSPESGTRSRTAWAFSMFMGSGRSAREARRAQRNWPQLLLFAVLLATTITVLWIYRLALFACFLLATTALIAYGCNTFYRHHRACRLFLSKLRSSLAGKMRDHHEATFRELLDRIADSRSPAFVREKYLQFLLDELEWDRRLLERVQAFAQSAILPRSIASTLEIALVKKESEVEMREYPAARKIDTEQSGGLA